MKSEEKVKKKKNFSFSEREGPPAERGEGGEGGQ